VCDDVDVAAAADGLADGAFYNNGQSCCSVERIYVHEAIHDVFVDRFVATVEGFVMATPPTTHLPRPLTRSEQADVLEAQVADAVAKGAPSARWRPHRGHPRARPGSPHRAHRVTADMA